MEDKKPITTYEQIKKKLVIKKKKVRQNKMKRWMSVGIKVFFGVLLAVLAFLYDRSDFSKIQKVNVIGNYYVTDQEIIDDIEFEIPTKFYSFLNSQLESKIDADSLVESINIQKHWLDQSMSIHVKEKEVLGYFITDKIFLVAKDGSSRVLLKDELSHLNQLIRFSEFKDKEHLTQLIDGLSRADKVLLSNISEVIRSPRSYDENYLRVIMSEGIEIHTSVYSLEKLTAPTYRQILNRLKPDQNCIVYDVFWKSAFAKPCQSDEKEVEIDLEIKE